MGSTKAIQKREVSAYSMGLVKAWAGAFGRVARAPLKERCPFCVSKVQVKARTVFYEHYAPSCTTTTYAQAQYQQRSMDAPYGQGNERPQVAEDTKLAVRVCALVRIKHAIEGRGGVFD